MGQLFLRALPPMSPLFVAMLALSACDSESGRDTAGADPSAGEMGDGDEADYGPPDTQYVDMGQEGGLLQSVQLTLNGSLCTGVLLNERTMLTAAHCVAPVHQLSTSSSYVTSPTLESMGHGHDSELSFGRIWVHDERYAGSADVGLDATDVAIVELRRPIYIIDDGLTANAGLGLSYPSISDVPPTFEDDGDGGESAVMWMNGRRLDGEESGFGMAYAGAAIQPPTNEAAGFHWHAKGTTVVTPGDSGGPLFREFAGEPNDGKGGIAGIRLYGLNSRVGFYARLDTLKSWVDTRAEYIRTKIDRDWITCERTTCAISMTHNLDGAWQPLGEVPQGTRLGVFAADGDRLVVSYPMADRENRVQVVDTSSGDFGFFFALPEAPPAAGDLRASSRYCHAASCDVVYKRDLADPDATPLGRVSCGTEMGVFVETNKWAVVSYPMADRDQAVQVVPNDGTGGWSQTPTNPGTCP